MFILTLTIRLYMMKRRPPKMSDFRDFLNPRDIARSITQSPNYRQEEPDDARLLLIFQTSVQKTWRIATDRRLYCAPDDRRKASARIQWSIPISDARAVQIRLKNYRERTGMLDIGKKRTGFIRKSCSARSRL